MKHAWNFQDLTGQRFERLEVLSLSHKNGGNPAWLCRCDCGREKVITARSLRTRTTRSCGCLHREAAGDRRRKDGMAATPEKHAWYDMIRRCYNQGARGYENYGARGITVCERWRNDFAAFYEDMGPRPNPGMSIDRIDNDKGYEPGNCRWATQAMQNTNKRDTRNLEYDGRTQCLTYWAREFGLTPLRLRLRLNAGWSVERALTSPRLRTGKKAQVEA